MSIIFYIKIIYISVQGRIIASFLVYHVDRERPMVLSINAQFFFDIDSIF